MQFLDDNGYCVNMENIPGRENGFHSYEITIWSSEKECKFEALFRRRMMTTPAFIGVVESGLYENQLKEYFGDKVYSKVLNICRGL